MGLSDVLTNPGTWGAVGQIGQAFAARDPSSWQYQLGNYNKQATEAELYRQALKKQEEERKKKQKLGIAGLAGKGVGGLAGFLAGGPVGMAVGMNLGEYAGNRLAGADPGDVPLSDLALRTGIGAGTAFAGQTIAKSLMASDLATAPSEAAATEAPEAVAGDSSTLAGNQLTIADPYGAGAEVSAPATGSVGPGATTQSAALGPVDEAGAYNPAAAEPGVSGPANVEAQMKNMARYGIANPSMKYKLGVGLLKMSPFLSTSLGGGGEVPLSMEPPPIISGKYGMSPDMVNSLNDMALKRWEASHKVAEMKSNLDLKKRMTAADEARVGVETVRAKADEVRAIAAFRRENPKYDKVEKGMYNPEDPTHSYTRMWDSRNPDDHVLIREAEKPKTGSNITTHVPSAESPTGYMKRIQAPDGEVTYTPDVVSAPAAPARDRWVQVPVQQADGSTKYFEHNIDTQETRPISIPGGGQAVKAQPKPDKLMDPTLRAVEWERIKSDAYRQTSIDNPTVPFLKSRTVNPDGSVEERYAPNFPLEGKAAEDFKKNLLIAEKEHEGKGVWYGDEAYRAKLAETDARARGEEIKYPIPKEGWPLLQPDGTLFEPATGKRGRWNFQTRQVDTL